MANYLLRMKNIADTRSTINHPVSKKGLILYVLYGLTVEYDLVAINLTSKQDVISFEEVQFHRIQRQSETSCW